MIPASDTPHGRRTGPCGESERQTAADGPRHAVPLQALAGVSFVLDSARSVGEVLQVVTDKAREIVGANQAATSVIIGGNWARANNAISYRCPIRMLLGARMMSSRMGPGSTGSSARCIAHSE